MLERWLVEVEVPGEQAVDEAVQPLLQAADTNCRPVDLEFGPDGALYVVDWFNPLIGHMQHNLRDPNRDHSCQQTGVEGKCPFGSRPRRAVHSIGAIAVQQRAIAICPRESPTWNRQTGNAGTMQQKILTVAVNPAVDLSTRVERMREIVRSVHPKAFISVSDVRSVSEGFIPAASGPLGSLAGWFRRGSGRS